MGSAGSAGSMEGLLMALVGHFVPSRVLLRLAKAAAGNVSTSHRRELTAMGVSAAVVLIG